MKYLRYLTLVGLLMLPLAYSQAQVRVGVGIGFGPGYVAAPVCPYGYYPDYPYGCAPYGYYGPEWFVSGVFIGAGPWYHGWGHPYWDHGFYRPGFYGRTYVGRDFDRDRGRVIARSFEGRERFVGRGSEGRGRDEGFHGRGDSHGGRR